MPKIAVNGFKMHYWQSGKGPEIVLIHGLGGNLAGWHLTMVPELRDHFRVTTYDLRAHGRSSAPPAGYTTRDMADDLLGVMDGLGIEQAHVVGHSWGADIALHFTLLHPERVRDLVLIEGAMLVPLADVYRRKDWAGWSYIQGTIETLSGKPIPPDKRYDLEYLLYKLIEIPTMYGPAKGRPRDEDVISRVAEVLRPMWNGQFKGGAALTVNSLERIIPRTLLIYEANSVFLEAYEVLSARLPNSLDALLPGADLRHFAGLEHPELILGHMKQFLGSADRPDLPSPEVM